MPWLKGWQHLVRSVSKEKGGEFIIKQQMGNFLLRSHSWHILNWEMYVSQEEMVLSSILHVP